MKAVATAPDGNSENGLGYKEQPTAGRSHWLRSILVGLLIAVGSLATGAYVATHWVERQILTTDNWVSLVAPLPKNPTVAAALGARISDEVFDAVPIQAKIADALPPQASFLASPLTSQLHSLTTTASQKLVASDAFQSIWVGANRLAMNRLVSTARGEPTPLQQRVNDRFNINLSDVSGKLAPALGSASNAIPALQPAAHKTIEISTDLKARADRIRQAIRTTDFLAATLPGIIAASLLGALAFSTRRRKTVMAIGLSVIFVALLELVALRWAKQSVLGQVKVASNVPAVTYIFDTLVGWLRNMVLVAAGIGAVIWILSLLAGPARWAQAFRSFFNAERLHTTQALAWWHEARAWVHHWQYYLWLGTAAIILIWLALVPEVLTTTIINAVLLLLSLFSLLHIIGYPGHKSLTRTEAPRQPRATAPAV